MKLRDYQTTCIKNIFDFICSGKGNPCVVAPTGSGKSVLIGAFMKQCLDWWPETKILLLTHQKELIEQDLDKFKQLCPELDYGVYSASLGEKDLSHSVTFASIQSIYKESPEVNCIIVDECHLINNEDEGRYQTFFKNVPNATIIGFTATPYRLGQGKLVEDGNIFDDYIETVGILELQSMGFLSTLKTKETAFSYNIKGVGIVAGDYKKGELDSEVNTFENNEAVCKEIARSLNLYHRDHCIVFCSSVDHAQKISDEMNKLNIPSVYIEGKFNKEDREDTIKMFTSGKARLITNVSILTTGFDYPAIDCIVMLRPTLSAGLYCQMLGRGLRIAEGKDDCLVLDFAGNVQRHGLISSVVASAKQNKGNGVAPMKTCPACLEQLPVQVRVCPSCGYQFPKHSKEYELYTGFINGDEVKPVIIKSWEWKRGIGKNEPHYERWEVTFTTNEDRQVREYIISDDRIKEKKWLYSRNLQKMYNYCSLVGMKKNAYMNPMTGEFRFDACACDLDMATPPAILFISPNKKNPKFTDIVGAMSKEDFLRELHLDNEVKEQVEETKKRKGLIDGDNNV